MRGPTRARDTERGWTSVASTAVPIGCAALPGVVAGVQLAGLLFFLNPHWPFEPGPVAATTAHYGAQLAGFSALALLPFTWKRPARARRILPWSLLLVFLSSGILFWVHASAFSFYLPAGINRRLVKAALWLSLAAVVTFYTALLHSLRRRPYTRRSAGLLVVVAALAVYVVLERREAFRPPVEVTPRPSSVAPLVRPNLLVVALASGSLDVVLPLSEQGLLPFFGALLRDGAYGRLTTIEPTRRLPLWTSLATGKYPYQHGVVDSHRYAAPFVSEDGEFHLMPVGVGFADWGLRGGALPTPMPSDSLPVWAICGRLGVPFSVVGWPGVAPPGERSRVEQPLAIGADPRFGAIHAFDAELLAAARADGDKAALVRSELAEVAPAGGARAVFVAIEGVEEVSTRTFGGYSQVHFDGVQKPEPIAASAALEAYYAYVDELLSGMWQALEEPRLLVVVSPYGIREPSWARRILALLRRDRRYGGLTSGAPDGLFLMRGEGVRAGFVNRVALADVVPTMLYALGFPGALDFDGRVVTEVFDPEFLRKNPLTLVPSYETMVPPGEGHTAR